MAGEDFEKTGVELGVKGMGKFLADLKKAGIAYDKLTGRFRDSSGKFVKTSDVLARRVSGPSGLGATLSKGLTAAIGVVGSLAAAIGTGLVAAAAVAVVAFLSLKKILEAVSQVIKAIVTSVISFGKESLMLAGRFEETEFAALAVGRAMGLQKDEILGAIDAVNEAGIRYDVAATTIAQFARNNINLADAVALVKIAQGAAILTNEDSTATMERLTQAIATGRTARLVGLGITTTATEAEERYAKANDRTVESLTKAEEKQALVNAIIEDGANLLQVYAEAQESPTKALRSFANRLLPEVKAAFGKFFLPAFGTAIVSVSDFAKALKESLSEGGKLFPVMVKLGAAASIVMDAFSAALNVLTNWLTSVETEATGTFDGLIVNMFQWGAGMVVALAEGIAEAASTALVQAMQFVGSILTFWFGAASDPRIAPMSEYGTAAMIQYLKGMTEADFSVLEAIQAPLKKVLTGPAFTSLSKDLISAIGGGGDQAGILGKIARQAGEFGAEIAELARLQFGLADANRDVAKTEERLANSRKRFSDAQSGLTAAIDAHNEALREGAVGTEKAGLLDQVTAAQQELALSSEQVAKDEAANEEAKTRAQTLQEQVSLQDRLLQQLLELQAAEDEIGDKLPKKVKGMADAIDDLGTAIGASDFDIDSAIKAAIDDAKALILEQGEELLEAIKAPFIQAAVDILIAWVVFRVEMEIVWQNITGFLETIIGPRWTAVIQDMIKNIGDKAEGEDTLLGAFAKLLLYSLNWWLMALQPLTDYIEKAVLFTFGDLLWILTAIWEEIKDKILGWIDKLIERFVWLDEAVFKVSEAAAGLLGIVRLIKTAWEEAVSAADDYIGKSPSPLEKGIVGASGALDELIPKMNQLSAPRATTAPGMVGGGASVTSMTRSAPISIGPVYISGDADLAKLEAVVNRAVRTALVNS